MSTITRLLRRATARGGGTVWWAARAVARVRVLPAAVLVLALVFADAGRWPWVAAGLGVVLVAVLLRLADDGTEEAHVGLRVRTSWRGWRLYGCRWTGVMEVTGLGDVVEGVPHLLRVRPTPTGDVLTVQTVPGQAADEFAQRAPQVAAALGARRCTVRATGPGAVWLEVTWSGAVAAAARLPARPGAGPVPMPVPHAVAIGRREDGQAWTIPMLDAHTLVAGEPGTGTSSLVRAMVAAARPLADEGCAELWVADTSGGMAVGDVAPFARAAFGGPAEVARLLEAARAQVRGRVADRRGRTERHRPTRGEPLVVVAVDDLSTALAGAAAELDDCCRRMVRALHIVLAEGPAVGVVLVGVLKDLDRSVLDRRHLFKTRVAFRLADPAATDHVLGAGARRLGAACERIPPPPTGYGVAYAWSAGDPAPVLVRVDGTGPQLRSA